ncbi:MAG: site-2 protease family protein [Oscillospiraceae bacterium]|nr:site-2 protease family protein [Oscillospiraceae bacterium]
MFIVPILRENPVALLYILPILVMTLTVHELCHGLAAFLLGDTTAKEQGRLSLNPLKHIDLMGFIALMIAGFGWAKPVGVDLRNLKKPKRDFALVAAAGPLSNFTLAFLLTVVFVILWYAVSLQPESAAAQALYYAILINIGLGVFNLLPIPPLDGSRLVAAFLPDRIYIKYLRTERFGMFIILALVMLGVLTEFLYTLRTAVFEGMIGAAEPPVRFLYQLLTR